MLYRCNECSEEYDYPALKASVETLCEACGGHLQSVERSASTLPHLVVTHQGKTVSRVVVDLPGGDGKASLLLGRSADNGVVLSDSTVSSRHAEIVRAGGRYYLRDLGSANGTFVNGIAAEETRLGHRDEIAVGPFVVRFEDPNRPTRSGGVSLSRDESAPEAVRATFRPGRTMLEESATETAPSAGRTRTGRSGAQHLGAEVVRLQGALAATASLATLHDERAILERLASEVFGLFPAERLAVFARGASGKQLRTVLARDRAGAALSQEIWLSRTIATRVLQDKLALVTTDARVDPRFDGRSIVEKGLHSVLVAPLLCGDELLGLVWADAREEGHVFQEADLPLFSGLVQVAAVALANARLMRRVRAETETRATLSRFLAPELVQQAMAQGLKLEMGGQLKEVTILFSDLRGFTRESEKLTATALVELLNAYFTRMVNCVFKNGGTLDKFIGDAVMALWGVPLHRPEDPLLAVRAALAMQQELEAFNRENAGKDFPALAMGIGIHTGEAVVGNIGSPRRMDWTVIGSAVNLASRIESQTGPGDVFVSSETHARLGGAVGAEPLPPIRMKNVSEPVRLYRIRTAGPQRR